MRLFGCAIPSANPAGEGNSLINQFFEVAGFTSCTMSPSQDASKFASVVDAVLRRTIDASWTKGITKTSYFPRAEAASLRHRPNFYLGQFQRASEATKLEPCNASGKLVVFGAEVETIEVTIETTVVPPATLGVELSTVLLGEVVVPVGRRKGHVVVVAQRIAW